MTDPNAPQPGWPPQEPRRQERREHDPSLTAQPRYRDSRRPRQQEPAWQDDRQQSRPGHAYQPPQGYEQPPGYGAPGNGPPGYGSQPPQQGYPGLPGGSRRPRRKGHGVRNAVLGVIGAFVLIIVIAAVASSGNGINKTGAPPAANAATSGPASSHSSSSSRQQSNSTTGPIGTTFTVTDTNDNGNPVKYDITLDKVIQHAAPSDSFNTAPSGDHLAAAEFTIKGVSGNEQDSADNCAAAVGTDSQTYQTGLESVTAGTDFASGQFNTSPGSSSVGWVSFEVKNGIKVASVQWSPGSGMSGDTATWTVGG